MQSKMHEMLKGVEEREGLEGWVQSKITKAPIIQAVFIIVWIMK